MPFTYCLPNEAGQKIEHTTDCNAVIIIGANGSGKSKLGAWIEQQDFENVHRIGAQRNLNFQEITPLKSYDQAEGTVLYGTNDKANQASKGYRWGWGKEYTTKLINDFDDVLAALIALQNNVNAEFVEQCKRIQNKSDRPDPPDTAIDKLIRIWNKIFPQRSLKLVDAKFLAWFTKGDGIPVEYSSTQMSDGERAVLYLAAQVLCVPENKTLIIDEPEVHLHRSIMNRLWKTLESYRPDCLFIYITHDTQFASMHGNAEKIWIKEFDGTNWKLEIIESNDLPEELLLDILGSRKPVLFVEGERNSYDTQLYSALYPEYYIVPCGSCTQVIARTKAFKNDSTLHHCQVYGIIDRDYRSDYEISKYREDNIYTIDVAEVENLFLVEELVRLIALHLGSDSDTVFDEVKEYIIQQRFARQIEKQICQSVVAQLKYQLSSAELSQKSEEEAKSSLQSVLTSLDYEKAKSEQESKFRDTLTGGDYRRVLQVFNEKSLSTSIGHYFGLNDKVYCNKVIALLNGVKHNEIVAAISPYLPTEIPR